MSWQVLYFRRELTAPEVHMSNRCSTCGGFSPPRYPSNLVCVCVCVCGCVCVCVRASNESRPLSDDIVYDNSPLRQSPPPSSLNPLFVSIYPRSSANASFRIVAPPSSLNPLFVSIYPHSSANASFRIVAPLSSLNPLFVSIYPHSSVTTDTY